MIGKLACATLTAAALALGACMSEQATSERPTYQASAAGPSACYTSGDLDVIHARMAQQVFATATLGCKTPGGARRFNRHYSDFIRKFQADLDANAESLQNVADRKGFDMDVVLTEMANRTAGRLNDPGFCARVERGLAWSLSSRVTSLSQVPPPYDFSPEMRMLPCRGGTR